MFSLLSKMSSEVNDILSDHNNFNANFMLLEASGYIAFPSITLMPTDEYSN
jgi:hypothetical protein